MGHEPQFGRRKYPSRLALSLAVALAALSATAGASKDETVLVSRQSATDGGAAANEGSYSPAVSSDGRYVAFESDADNLSTLDDNTFQNLFLRDTQLNTITLISRQSAGDGGAAADGFAGNPSISADGRFVAFRSDADNLSTLDDNTLTNIFVRDTQLNTTTLVSRQGTGDGGAGANANSFSLKISADGRFVVFASDADNLSTLDDNNFTNVFLRDTQTNSTTLVSRQSVGDGGLGADSDSSGPSVSADGHFVAFASGADNLSSLDDNSFGNVFVRDTQTGTTTLASRQSAADGGAGANDDSESAAISADGRFVAFNSNADNLSTLDNNGVANIFVRDLQAGTTTLVTRQSGSDGGAGADDASGEASISADGR